jgi:hypothetical protein
MHAAGAHAAPAALAARHRHPAACAGGHADTHANRHPPIDAAGAGQPGRRSDRRAGIRRAVIRACGYPPACAFSCGCCCGCVCACVCACTNLSGIYFGDTRFSHIIFGATRFSFHISNSVGARRRIPTVG